MKKNLDKLEENLKTLNLLLEWANQCMDAINWDMTENIIKILNKGEKDEMY